MAERRMFAKSIIDSDVFLAMPMSTQALYFHLSMRADDDGFVNKPNSIRRMIGASEDDLKLLIAKRYVLAFDSGVIVIKHWRMHNYIQKDRYKETTYIEEKSMLTLDGKNSYVYKADTPCIQDVSTSDTQVSIGKYSIGKDSIDYKKKSISKDIPKEKRFCKPTVEEIEIYCKERNNRINAISFYDYYESIGWKVGNKPMKDWQACVRTWERNQKENSSIPKYSAHSSTDALNLALERSYKDENIEIE